MKAILCSTLLLLAAGAQPDSGDLARLAAAGWTAARAAAATGGTRESLAPAVRAQHDLEKLAASAALRLQAEYARVLIAAAMAAAQDEHAEMELHLTHARDLSDRLRTSSAPAEWPLPIDEAEGELLFEVDRYPEAVRAFQRAADKHPNRRVYLGLARSAVRVGNAALACESYREWLKLVKPDGPGFAEAKEYVSRCP